MNKIKLNDILHLTEEEIKNSKMELNITEGSGGKQYIDNWLSLSYEEKERGITDCSYWSEYGGKKNFEVGQMVFSFIRKGYDEWLLISAARILSVPDYGRATVEILEQYKGFFGRLIMNFHKGDTFGRWCFNLSYLKNEEEIIEILSCMYNGEQFEGYDNVNLTYKKLKDILAGKIMPSYYEALKKVTGIYCLTDIKTGKLYIGSATGEEGVAQRWGNYLSSKHGGNKKLIELYKQKGDDYFERYFTFTLVEYFGLSYDPEKIRKREKYWKICLNTVEHGYNDNY